MLACFNRLEKGQINQKKSVVPKMNILFICKFNRFRSMVAEAYFNKINKNKAIKAKSAGIIKGNYPLDFTQVSIAKEFNINLKGKPRGLTTDLLKWQNIIVIVADDIPPSLFEDNEKYGKQLVVWKIKDAATSNLQETRRAISEIIQKIDKLVIELK